MLTIGKTGRRDFALPDDFITETIAILAKRGAGKTYLMRKLAEQMVKAALPVVIIDPIGVCWGLRSSADGKRDGLPVIIFGGDNGDLPLEAESGRVLAEWVIAERRPVVFDLSTLPSKAAERRFVTDFAQHIYRRNRDPLHIMLDEADNFAPQSPQQGDKSMLGAINTLARRGRARGIGITMATQRSAVLNKNVLTQAEVLVVMRMTAPQDRKAIEAWIEYHGTREDRREVLGSLGELPVGTAWFWSPGRLDGLSRVKVGMCETFDSSATPKAGAKIARPKLGPIDLGALNDKIQATVERAKDDDPRELRVELARAKRCIQDGRACIENLERERNALRAKPAMTDEQRDAIRAGLMKLENARDALADMASAAEDSRREIAAFQDAVKAMIDPEVVAPSRRYAADGVELKPGTPSDITFAEDSNVPGDGMMVDTKAFRPPANTVTSGTFSSSVPKSNGGRKLSGGKRKILTALAQYGIMVKRRLAALTGYKMTGGGFQNLLSGLRTTGYIMRGEDIHITDAGRAVLGGFVPLPVGVELLEMWEAKLGKAPRLCLHALYDVYPRELTREELAELTGYAAGGGGFSNALSRLNTLGLIDRTSTGIKATDNLFVS